MLATSRVSLLAIIALRDLDNLFSPLSLSFTSWFCKAFDALTETSTPSALPPLAAAAAAAAAAASAEVAAIGIDAVSSAPALDTLVTRAGSALLGLGVDEDDDVEDDDEEDEDAEDEEPSL